MACRLGVRAYGASSTGISHWNFVHGRRGLFFSIFSILQCRARHFLCFHLTLPTIILLSRNRTRRPNTLRCKALCIMPCICIRMPVESPDMDERAGCLWAYSKPGGDVLFDWKTSRAATCLDNVISADFAGIVQSDGYGAYPAFAKTRNGAITFAGCWAHVRRKFHEAKAQSPCMASWFLLQIAHLYQVEAELREPARRAVG